MPDQQAVPEEERLRRDVALCTRMLAAEGLLAYSGHVSARLPGGDRILIQPYDENRIEVTPECLIEVDLEGRVVSNRFNAKPPDETVIHTEIMKSRPDAMAVLHFHPETAVLFSIVEGVALAPVKNHASRWASGIPVHEDASKINSPEQGKALAKSLGPHNGVLMRAHGATILSESLPALLVDAVHFNENAECMYRASMLGKVLLLSQAEMEDVDAHTDRGHHAMKLWKFYEARAFEAGHLDGIDNPAD
jgi:ribulose-5-phosphate 4-epimerase/fuculose-1-phosphate aldolase